MKKMLALVVVGIILFSFTACSKNAEKNFVGTWVVDFIEYEGSKFSVDEWKSMEDDDLSDFYIIFKDGGKAYVYDDEDGELLDWLYSDENIMIGDVKCSVVDNRICFDYYGDIIYLKKSSDNQEIPTNSEEDIDEYVDTDESENVSSQDADESQTSNTDWRQFLKDYEAWVDNYITVINKYKNNPSDLTILSEYTELAADASEWALKADDVELEINDADEALEYSKEVLRIAQKLANASAS